MVAYFFNVTLILNLRVALTAPWIFSLSFHYEGQFVAENRVQERQKGTIAIEFHDPDHSPV